MDTVTLDTCPTCFKLAREVFVTSGPAHTIDSFMHAMDMEEFHQLTKHPEWAYVFWLNGNDDPAAIQARREELARKLGM